MLAGPPWPPSNFSRAHAVRGALIRFGDEVLHWGEAPRVAPGWLLAGRGGRDVLVATCWSPSTTVAAFAVLLETASDRHHDARHYADAWRCPRPGCRGRLRVTGHGNGPEKAGMGSRVWNGTDAGELKRRGAPARPTLTPPSRPDCS